jgi:hypothetical protein
MLQRNLPWFVTFLFLFPLISTAQISQPGIPPSFELKDLKSFVPVEQMPSVDVQALLEEDQIFDSIKDVPWRFGENISVGLNPNNSGVWELLPGNDRLWRLGVHSPGAYTINLTFDQYLLPPGAQLYVYSADRSFVIGAFTSLNNQEDGYFATTLVPGDSIFIEYFEPEGAAFPGELNLQTVTHAYRDPMGVVKAFGDSGWCNLNVACPEAEGWEEQINSVVMLVSGSNGFCTGVMINNTSNDATPFLLTANHCNPNPSTVVVWFNWQSETCTNPSSSPPHDAMSGSLMRARHNTSDFYLLELNQPVPQEYNPFFAGWNRSLENAITETIIGIHHPRGDIKKFSYADGGVQAASYLGNPGSGTTHWRIVWSGGTTTEPGSSGSPIFDAQGRILGQLHGGYAACGNVLPDWYGRFGISWTGGGSPSNRLSDWLDPLGLNPDTWNGFDPFGEVVQNPLEFDAQAISPSSIELSWVPNELQQPIMIAFNTEDQFGNPSGPYSLNQEIPGGGTVIYLGDDESFLHSPLDFGTEYFYKAWSYSAALNFSEGIKASAVTPCPIFSDFPFAENFETDTLPLCWSQEFITGQSAWTIGNGNNAGNPDNAYSGDQNIFFREPVEENLGNTTRLISPYFDFEDYELGQLTFFLYNEALDDHQDTLRILFEMNGSWVELETFDLSLDVWTEAVIDIPESTGEFRIAFEAVAGGGHGISIDQIVLAAYYDVEFPSPTGLSAEIVLNDQVDLTWDAPEVEGEQPVLSGFRVYRNGQLKETLNDPDLTSFSDVGLPVGVYQYFVTALYQTPHGESYPSNTVEVEIEPEIIQYTLNLNVIGNGLTDPAPGTYLYNADTQLTVQAVEVAHWTFSHWLENGEEISSEPSLPVLIDQDRDITAVFQIDQHTLTLSSMPEGIGEQSGEGVYDYGQVVSVNTTTSMGWIFQHWKEGNTVISTNTSLQVEMTGDRELVAHFQPVYYDIILGASPESGGTVAGEGSYAFGSEVTVVATPEQGWDFNGWRESGQLVSSQPSYTFNVTGNRNLTAHFSIQSFLVSAQVQPQGSGTVSGTGTYNYGDTANLIAVKYSGWMFAGWEENGEIVSTENPWSFQVFENRSFIARMETTARELVVEVQGEGTTTPPAGTYEYHLGEVVELNALPGENWIFSHWKVNDDTLYVPDISITIDGDVTATAVFDDATSDGLTTMEDAVSVFPVPASGRLNIVLSGLSGTLQLRLVNINGQQVKYKEVITTHAQEQQFSLDISGVKPGVYILKIIEGNQMVQRKVVVQ